MALYTVYALQLKVFTVFTPVKPVFIPNSALSVWRCGEKGMGCEVEVQRGHTQRDKKEERGQKERYFPSESLTSENLDEQ